MTSVKDEIHKFEGEFEGFVRTLELKFFKGKLHQKVVHPITLSHAWVPVDSHDVEAPKPNEEIAGSTTPDDNQSATPPPGGMYPTSAAHYPGSPEPYGTVPGAEGARSDVVKPAEPPAPGAPPPGLVASGNAQGLPEQAVPAHYDASGAIPPPPARAPQPADVAALKANPAAPPPAA